MKTTALIEKGNDGNYCIFTPNIKSTIIGMGTTVAEAKADFENSVKELHDMFNGNLPGELKGITFEYKYDIASVFNYLDWLNVSKVAEKINLNPSLLRHYRKGDTYISEKQAAKIEKGLHRLGAELSAILL